jgi:hypothetical protein
MKKAANSGSAFCQLHAGFLLGLPFNPEDGSRASPCCRLHAAFLLGLLFSFEGGSDISL